MIQLYGPGEYEVSYQDGGLNGQLRKGVLGAGYSDTRLFESPERVRIPSIVSVLFFPFFTCSVERRLKSLDRL